MALREARYAQGIYVSLTLCFFFIMSACSGGDGVSSDANLRQGVLKATESVRSEIEAEAASLGANDFAEDLDFSLSNYVKKVIESLEKFSAASANLDRAGTNTSIFVGMNLVLHELTGAARPGMEEYLDDLFAIAEKRSVQDFNDDERFEATVNLLRPIANVALLKDRTVIRQLLPPGSPEAQRFAPWIQYVNDDPQATIPSPADGEGSEGGPASWNALVEAIVNEPEFDGRLGRVLYLIDTEIERAT